MTTVDTLTNLTTFGGETTGPIKVPANAKKLAQIWRAIGAYIDTAGDKYTFVLRLSGKGMASGQQDFTLAGMGSGVTATSVPFDPMKTLDVDILVVPNESINVAVMQTGATQAIWTAAITLVFEV